jgi:hypothetical protein
LHRAPGWGILSGSVTNSLFSRSEGDTMNNETGTTDWEAWCDRCAQRLAELDDAITTAEARRLAKDVYAFERTRAMGPDSAAEFIAVEMSRPDRGPFERRTAPR